jgi:excisionase family DNA binding protein
LKGRRLPRTSDGLRQSATCTSRSNGGFESKSGVVIVSIIDERALRNLMAEALRGLVQEELAKLPGRDEYLSVRGAADVAGVIPGTIRSWVDQGRLGRYQAGRHMRIKRSELESLMRNPQPQRREVSPEERALEVFRGRGGLRAVRE